MLECQKYTKTKLLYGGRGVACELPNASEHGLSCYTQGQVRKRNLQYAYTLTGRENALSHMIVASAAGDWFTWTTTTTGNEMVWGAIQTERKWKHARGKQYAAWQLHKVSAQGTGIKYRLQVLACTCTASTIDHLQRQTLTRTLYTSSPLPIENLDVNNIQNFSSVTAWTTANDKHKDKKRKEVILKMALFSHWKNACCPCQHCNTQ